MLCGIDYPEIMTTWRAQWIQTALILKPTEAPVPASGPPATHHGTGEQTGSTGIECTRCGAWVVNQAKHVEWHNDMASRANRWLRSVRTG